MKVSKLLKVINSRGATFAAIRSYDSKSTGEIANHTIVSGYSYENANAHDLAILKALTAQDIAALAVKVGYVSTMVQDAVNALIKSIEAPSKVLSQAQANTYIHLGAGIKEYNGDDVTLQGNIYVTGLLVKKTVLVAGTKKEVNSKPATICKHKVSKALGLRKENIRQYILKRGEVKMRGVSLA
jgi:hypothetical protein